MKQKSTYHLMQILSDCKWSWTRRSTDDNHVLHGNKL